MAVNYLLDTNACITLLKRSDSSIARRLRSQDPSEIALCSVVKAELYYGAFRSSRSEENQRLLERLFGTFQSFPLDDKAASAAGAIRADLSRRGAMIGPYDCLIAAIAIVNHATLVTHNVGEFERIGGLSIEDWET